MRTDRRTCGPLNPSARRIPNSRRRAAHRRPQGERKSGHEHGAHDGDDEDRNGAHRPGVEYFRGTHRLGVADRLGTGRVPTAHLSDKRIGVAPVGEIDANERGGLRDLAGVAADSENSIPTPVPTRSEPQGPTAGNTTIPLTDAC